MAFTRRLFLTGLASCPLCAAAAKAAEGSHWSYDSARQWGDADPAYRACAIGSEQSPIDLTGAIRADIHAPNVSWKSQAFKIVNNGHTIQAIAAPGSVAVAEGRLFELKQFHFHTPSEHAIQGKRAAMEAHFVHTGEGGELLVLGAFLEAGDKNGRDTAFTALMRAAPNTEGEAELKALIDLATLLPETRHFFRYEGSLTTPPCSEVVNWCVFSEPVEVEASDIEKFKKLFPKNARSLQPLHRRLLLSD